MRLLSKAVVVSNVGKGFVRSQVRIQELSESESQITASIVRKLSQKQECKYFLR